MLRTQTSRREAPLDPHVEYGPVPDPGITRAEDPEVDAVLADSVGLALLLVLECVAECR